MDSNATALTSRSRLADFVERVAAPVVVAAIVGLTTAAFRLSGAVSAVEHELTRVTDERARHDQFAEELRQRIRDLESDSRRVGERDAEMRARIDNLERRFLYPGVNGPAAMSGMNGNGKAP